jgi:hypothetical protein
MLTYRIESEQPNFRSVAATKLMASAQHLGVCMMMQRDVGSYHAISRMTLTPDHPLEAHLWRAIAQSDGKTQPVFRSNRD